MIKAAMIIGQLAYGGAERQLFEVATRLEQRHIQPFVYCLSARTHPYKDWLEERNIPVRVLPRHSHFDVTRSARLRKWISRDCIDIAHSWLIDDNFYTALALVGSRIPWIASMRERRPKRDRLRKALDRWAMKRASRIVANQSDVRDFLAREYQCPFEKITLIGNGIDLERLKVDKSRAELRQQYGLPLDDRILLYAGRLEPVKQVHILLEALAILKRQGASPLLLVAGDGSQREPLMRKSQSLGIEERALFLGQRDDLPNLYHAADLTALCSVSEGLPNVILESMGCGVPAVVSASCGCGDLIEHGISGWILPEVDSESYSHQIKIALSGGADLATIGERARSAVAAHYEVNGMVDRMAGLCHRLIGDEL